MSAHADRIRLLLSQGPAGARTIIDKLGISQPTLSRALATLGDEVLRLGAARSIQYVLRDIARGLSDIPVYRVTADGKVGSLGLMVPVRPDGFVMCQSDGVERHSHGLPWWLFDIRPQGFLGRAYAEQHASALGLPARLAEWSDAHALRALLAHGHDAMGNLLLGDVAREHFLNAPLPTPIVARRKGPAYARLAAAAARGELPASSAGGEQPKFVACVLAAGQPQQVLVKFSLPDGSSGTNPVTERWRDLLLAEHLALETLAANGVAAALSQLVDHGGQRFLETARFDRVGALGRRALLSLTALEAEFVGDARAPWPVLTARLAQAGHITPQAAAGAALLYAFGTLIGNTDMHNGNLSFVGENGAPFELAPAYDMLPMGFAPRAGGGLPDTLPPPQLHASVGNPAWAQALDVAKAFLGRVRADDRFSDHFQPCVETLSTHLAVAGARIARLG